MYAFTSSQCGSTVDSVLVHTQIYRHQVLEGLRNLLLRKGLIIELIRMYKFLGCRAEIHRS